MRITTSKLETPRIFVAYCNKCKRNTDHVLFRISGTKIAAKCAVCGKTIVIGNEINGFEEIECPRCGRKTLHAFTKSYPDYFTCIGCGRRIYLGNPNSKAMKLARFLAGIYDAMIEEE